MSFLEWLEKNENCNIQAMPDEHKDGAVYAFMTDPLLRDLVVAGFNEYMIEDGHIAACVVADDAQSGKMLKDSLYACFESEIVDAIESYTRYKNGRSWLSNVLEKLVN